MVEERNVVTMAQAAIEVDDLTKDFPRPGKAEGALRVLDHVAFDVPVGSFFSIIGASGCGKTTLLRMIAGLEGYRSGRIRVNGEVVRGVPSSIGFVFQDPSLLPWRTVHDNLILALEQSTLSTPQKEEAVADSLELTALGKFANYYPRMLSGGMQQRVGVARALVGRPSVLLMDEPLSALDAFTRRRLQEEIGDILFRAATTTVLVTHDVDEAIIFADKIVVMGSSPGRIRSVLEVPLERPRRNAAMAASEVASGIRARILEIVLAGGASEGVSS